MDRQPLIVFNYDRVHENIWSDFSLIGKFRKIGCHWLAGAVFFGDGGMLEFAS